MFALFILIVCISSATTERCACGIENSEERIIGGDLVESNKHPWMAFILVITPEGAYQCGGVIISDHSILTAAHCFHGAESANVSIGSIYDASNNILLEAQNAVIHGRYNHKTHAHDIAILRLREPMQFSESVRPICLPPSGMAPKGQLTVAGWGLTESGQSSNRLREASIHEYPYESCNREWNGTLTPWQFCAMSEGKDTCGGDGGGPAIRRWRGRNYVVGIVSYGDVLCKGAKKSLYTKVNSYLGWIRRHSKGDVFCN